ncbi:MAG: hydrogenase maturation nickel metallochaperone HypA, partial [Candidatus Cloacimonadaceae bacterium]|nr:hydrogenase maturation nickel metallochaperone HypA [Candidatus Cloacimonadaceae bacterium]
MHEAAMVKSILDTAYRVSLEAKLGEVHSVKVMIGKFHHIVNTVMLLHFDLMKTDYDGFAQAVLDIEEKDLIIRCNKCKHSAKLDVI